MFSVTLVFAGFWQNEGDLDGVGTDDYSYQPNSGETLLFSVNDGDFVTQNAVIGVVMVNGQPAEPILAQKTGYFTEIVGVGNTIVDDLNGLIR